MNRTFTARIGHLPGFLGLQRSTVGLLGVVILVGMGERMAELLVDLLAIFGQHMVEKHMVGVWP